MLRISETTYDRQGGNQFRGCGTGSATPQPPESFLTTPHVTWLIVYDQLTEDQSQGDRTRSHYRSYTIKNPANQSTLLYWSYTITILIVHDHNISLVYSNRHWALMARCVQLKLRVQYLQYNSYCRDTCSYHPVASSAKTNQEGLDTRSLILLPLKIILLTLT